ncbi:histone-like nucleoid-structuring protein Lsr2 [Williamsia sterculiae]|uniref:Lsr2 protein n=1 Tax=Williamsia sterculiae TaxID=1344003 RepID=A0A1N7GFB5_9NOCA|nr:Lsr2 family protein [Williamsia sterculiae]SIS11212.1 Lsr2 protein [Williamsia sterculiae]
MARNVQTIIEFVDDLDGTVVDEGDINTVAFSYNGKSYEIDLTDKNAAKFDKAIQPFVDAAAEVKGQRGRGRKAASDGRSNTGSGRSKDQLAAIREWAGKNNYDVSPRGRIRAEILDAFDAAH